jgi:hypothetical protein
MGTVDRLLWLPVAPENFFSAMTDPAMLVGLNLPEGHCRGDDDGGIPHLRESVFRRLVQVLPASFGYDRDGTYTSSAESSDAVRPRSLTMTLRPAESIAGLESARPANAALVSAGITTVTMTVDEHGFYSFVAALGPDGDDVAAGAALDEHIVTAFGGTFDVDRFARGADRQRSVGAVALRRYNGLDPSRAMGERDERPVGRPLGILTFNQLNIVLEGICNASLLPAVFFEHYESVAYWYARHRGDSSIIIRLDDLLRRLIVPGLAGSQVDRARSLRRFLTISRGSLQWMRRSVESVRRSLVDQLMAVSHRQARLVQLDLAGLNYERTPEMTGTATESQMRGYVMLMATKLPLLASVGDAVTAAALAEQPEPAGELGGPDEPDPAGADSHPFATLDLDEPDSLVSQARAWTGLFGRLVTNVDRLEVAVESDWQERLLYQQEQARSEQEAMAEIERSRRGRHDIRRVGDTAYNAIMLLITSVTLFGAVEAGNYAATQPGGSFWSRMLSLWPILLLGLAVIVAWPVLTWFRQWRRQRTPSNEVYSYEFTFRLDDKVEPDRLHQHLANTRVTTIRGPFRAKVRRLGGCRWEEVASDTSLLKIHSVAALRLTWGRYARFEIVTEVLRRDAVSATENSVLFVRQCRVFGDSPEGLDRDGISSMVMMLVGNVVGDLTTLDLDRIMEPIDDLFGHRHPATSTPAGPRPATGSGSGRTAPRPRLSSEAGATDRRGSR